MTSATTPQPIYHRAVALLERLTAISSPSGDTGGLRRSATVLGDALEGCGLAVEIRDQASADGSLQPVLYARGPAATGGRHLLLIGHLDTVLPATPPVRDGDRLLATGAVDMKGGLAMLVGALELLRDRGQAPPEDLLLAVVPDEEVAGQLSRQVVAQLGADARGLWVLEPGRRRGDAETLVAGRRGMFHWQLEVTGRGAHAGNDYWHGRSALDAAAAFCLGARDLAHPDTGPTVNAGRLIAGDASFVDHLAEHVALIGTSRQINVVPDRARVEGEARFLTAADGARLAADLDRLAAAVAAERQVTARLVRGQTVPPLEPIAASRRWCQQAVDAARDAGWALAVEDDRGGISFPNFLPAPGAVPVLDGLGPTGGGMHTRDEYVDLPSLARRIALLATLLAAARSPAGGG